MPQESRRRTVYLTSLLIGLPVMVLVWLTQQAENPFIRISYPVLVLFLTWGVWMLLYCPKRLQYVERLTFWSVTLMWLGMMTYNLHSESDLTTAWRSLAPAVYMNLILLCVFAHLVSSPRQALRDTLILLASTAAIGSSRVVPHALAGQAEEVLVELIRFEIYLAVIIGFLYVLAKSKDDYLEARLETERVKMFAYEDTLTGLPNRRLLEEELQRHSSLIDRHQRPFALISFDLDKFKSINDHYGHPAGDAVLQYTAEVVRPLLRTSDILGRWGGEEFLILAPETTLEQAQALAERIREGIEKASYPRGIHVTASFGVVVTCEVMTVEASLFAVDQLLYQAKQQGRNQVIVAQPNV